MDEWKRAHPDERRNPYSQEAMAKTVGVRTQTYNYWEVFREPSVRRLRQIAVALDMDESELLPDAVLPEALPASELEQIIHRCAELGREARRIEERLREIQAWMDEQKRPSPANSTPPEPKKKKRRATDGAKHG